MIAITNRWSEPSARDGPGSLSFYVRHRMRTLSPDEQREFRQKHLAHRLTLLRCYSSRRAEGFAWTTRGDLFRCAKDSALISIRLLLSAMGLKGYFDQKTKDFILIENTRLRNCRDYDDILIDQLGGELPDVNSLSLTPVQARLLAGVSKRADKELAHLTATFNDEFNKDATVDEAAQLVVKLLDDHLYEKVVEQMPPIDT